MSQDKISKIIGIVLSLVIALLAVFGYDVGVIQPREAAPQEQGLSRAVGDTNFTNVVAEDVTATDTVTGATVAATSNLTTPKMTVSGTITGTTGVFTNVTLGGIALDGPYQFGSASTVISGSLIAHGLATTPTIFLMTPGASITTPLYIQAMNATSVTVGINDGIGVTPVYWLAGK